MIDAEKLAANYQHRFSKEEILTKFSVLRVSFFLYLHIYQLKYLHYFVLIRILTPYNPISQVLK